MPSFTFVSTANAFVLRGATPVFVEIAPDTLTLDADAVADAVTPATRVVVPVHYAGGACAMDAITAIAERHGLMRHRGRGAGRRCDVAGARARGAWARWAP